MLLQPRMVVLEEVFTVAEIFFLVSAIPNIN